MPSLPWYVWVLLVLFTWLMAACVAVLLMAGVRRNLDEIAR